MNTEPMPKCPQCGAALPPDAPAGLCPNCLMALNLRTDTAFSGDAPVAQPPLPPEQIAPHFPQLEILECLGRGGMGVVYRARQKTLNRFVALKLLAPERVNDPKFAGRFAREAQALAALNHPNIVTIHDFGQAGGFYFLLMEFVDGMNLRQLLQMQKFTPEEALAIVPPLCDALQFAHEHGIVHRDIKPENILLDKSGRVKVADFGIAKMLANGDPGDSQAAPGEATRGAVGTRGYSAPEQETSPQRVDSRADIYSLGVVFYEMLTGELPGKNIEPPSHKVHIDVRLDEVVLRALEKKPELRYQQASALKTEVETIAQTAPIPGPASNLDAFAAAAQTRDYQLNIGHCLGRGWNLVAHNFWEIVGVATLIGLLQHAADSTLIGIVVGGPLSGGLWLFFLKKIRGEQANVGTAFSGFVVALAPLFLGGLVTFLLILAGLICLVLPGIYFAVAWAFTLMLIADKGLDFWPAMGLSRKVISKHWWKFLGFFVVLGLIELAGYLMFLVGIFIAAPIALAALAYAYEDVFAPAAAAANFPATVPATATVRPASGAGTAIGIAAGAAAVVLTAFLGLVLIAFLGVLAAIATPNFVKARQHALALREQQHAFTLQDQQRAIAEQEQEVKERGDANSWNGLGWAQFSAGKSAAAEASFQKAVSIEPNHPGALNGLGQIYLSQRKYDEAEKYLLQAAPNAPAAAFGLARLYLLEGKFEQAEKWAQDLVDSGQGDETAKKMLEAAKAKKLSDGLRMLIEPPSAAQGSRVLATTDSGNSNSNAIALPAAAGGSSMVDPATGLPVGASTSARTEIPNSASTNTNAAGNSVSAESWSPTLAPGEKPDLQKVLNSAKSLTDEGSYAEALQHYLWYFEHSRNDPGQKGVRLSFALSDWIELGRRYPKARQALIEIRDADARQFSDGGGYQDLFQEVSGINQYLNEGAATVALFKAIEQHDPQLAKQCYPFVQDRLVQKGEYDKCLGYLGDPQAAFDQIRTSRERIKNWEDQQASRREQEKQRFQAMAKTNPAFAHIPVLPEPPPFAENNFVGQTRQLIEILVGAGWPADAARIQAEAVAVLDDARLKSAVRDAEEKIRSRKSSAEAETGDAATLAEQPPVVVETFPMSGARDVPPGETEIRVRFSKPMSGGSWSWSSAWENSTPESLEKPSYESDHKTCVWKVKLEPGKTYGYWLNSEKFTNFKDTNGLPAVPYLLVFSTKGSPRQSNAGQSFLAEQIQLANAGNYWAKFQLWQGFSQGEVPVFDSHGHRIGKNEVTKDPAAADKWLSELVKGAYLAKFEPVNGFNPRTPQEMFNKFNEHDSHLRPGADSLGGASFFRTTKQGGKLIGSFLTATPDEFKAALEQNPDLKLISIEPVTPEIFLAHEASQPESL